jgi:hypothetical protein
MENTTPSKNTSNTSKTNKSSNRRQKYMCIDNFPTLLVETVEDGEFKDTRRDEGFFQTYEDATTIEIIPYEEQLKTYLGKGLYKTAVKYSLTQSYNVDEKEYIDGISTQDIQYVKQIADSLSGKVPEYQCDLAGIPKKYIITETMMLDDGEYVICGYPAPSKMRNYFALMNDDNIKSEIDEIHRKQRSGLSKLYAEMYNFVMKSNGKNNLIDNVDTDMYKFVPKSKNCEYLELWYKENPKLREWIKSDEFQEKLKFMDDNGLQEHKQMVLDEIAKSLIPEAEYSAEMEKLEQALPEYDKYVNELLLEYLNKPMTRIRYYFVIFRKHINPEIGLVPAVFNIKQLESKHTPLLEKVLDMIQIRIPGVFGILEDSRNNIDRYKLFHSYAKYGDFFYITTEYLHTMSNITQYAYLYKNSITLEELIYSSSRMSDAGNPFWKDVKLEYELKKVRIEIAKPRTILDGNSTTRYTNSGRTRKNNSYRSKIIQGDILLMYEKTYVEYVVIYRPSGENKIMVMQIKSNMGKCINDIKTELKRQSKKNAIYTCNNSSYRNLYYNGKLFYLQNDIHEITIKEFNDILRHNPLIVKTIRYPNQEKFINLNNLFKTELINFNFTNIELLNLNNIKPIIYFNIIMNKIYLDALINYKNGNISLPNKYIENKGNNTTKIYGNYDNINCIINPNNCGYNLIEIYETNKVVIWILPFNKNEYLRNFTYINRAHLDLFNFIKHNYINRENISFVHITSTYIFGLLHFHKTKYSDYKHKFIIEEKGSSIIKELTINDLINKITSDNKYFNDINLSILNVSI